MTDETPAWVQEWKESQGDIPDPSGRCYNCDNETWERCRDNLAKCQNCGSRLWLSPLGWTE